MKLEQLKQFCYKQFNNLEYEDSYKDMVYFIFDGTPIVNPFLDECGLFEVDPFEHYGDKFLSSKFVDMLF